jgi:hypothetical protein
VSVLTAPVQIARTRPLLVATVLSALLGVVYLIWQPPTTDLAAQTFRADLWDRAGFVIWNPYWYGGHLVPGYSLLYPPLGAWLGVALTGALSAVVATWLFARLSLEGWGERAWLGVVWFGLASGVALYSGRITFALGLALGLAALLAVQRRRPGWAALGAVLTAAASPVAGLFLGMLCTAVLLADRFPARRDAAARPTVRRLPVDAALAAAIAAALALMLVSIAFPTTGYHPFGLGGYVWIPLLALVVFAFADRDHGVVIWALALYALLGLFAVLVETPLGGNVTRLGATFAGPLLAILLIRRRPVLLALLAIPLLWWQWETTVQDVSRAAGDPAAQPGYYEPLLDQLAMRDTGAVALRVHIPPTESRWEAVEVAERYAITRGWLRQEETDDFPLFRSGPIDPDRYLEWLIARGVDYVAVPDAELDYTARTELELVDSSAYPLKQIWAGEHWRLFAVPGGGAGKRIDALELRADGFTVRTAARTVSVPVRYTPYFRVAEGAGCVEQDPRSDQRTRVVLVEPPRAGSVEISVEARFSPAGALGRDRDCSGE